MVRTLRASFILIIITLLLTACILKRAQVPDEVIDNEYANTSVKIAMKNTNREMAQARIKNLDIYAPNYMSEANSAMGQARALLRAGAEDKEILTFVYLADDNLRKAKQVKEKVKSELKEVFSQLDVLQRRGASSSYSREFGNLSYDAQELAAMLEKLNSKQAMSNKTKKNFEHKKQKLLVELHKLEILVVKHNTLSELENVLEEVEALNGDDLAPITFETAVRALESAKNIIENDVNDSEAIKQAGLDCQFAVYHAYHVTRAVVDLNDMSGDEYEKHILKIEDAIEPIAKILRNQDIRNHALYEQSQLVLNSVRKLVRENEKLKNAVNGGLENQSVDVKRLKEELKLDKERIEEMQNQIAQLKLDQSELRQKQTPVEQKVWLLEQENNELRANNKMLKDKELTLLGRIMKLQNDAAEMQSKAQQN